MSFSGAVNTTPDPLNPTIDDQELDGYGKCYGGANAHRLKRTDANRAFLNIDNYMYFALVRTSRQRPFPPLLWSILAKANVQSGSVSLSHYQAFWRIWVAVCRPP